MAGANAVTMALFATLYVVAGARYLSQAAFVVCLGVVFVVATTLWLRVEGRHRALEPIQRLGRVAFGLVVVVIAAPAILLMPLFWLDTVLPPEAGLRPLLAPAMSIVLIALLLTTVVNVVGAVTACGRAAAARLRG